jgi:RHS repeat-associated protein
VTDAVETVGTEQLSMPFGTTLPFTQTYGGENSYQHPTLSNPSKKRFTIYDRIDMTGLDYAVNRFYCSQQGRFTQVDPIDMDAASLGDPQSLNLYAYCGNDPINRRDPDGLFWGAIGSFFKAIGKAILSKFTSGSSVSSGPDFRTPPTFPGSLPGINAAERSGQGGFRTTPFIGGLLQQEGQKRSWVDWYKDQLKYFFFGSKENYERYLARVKERKLRERIAAIKAHARLCAAMNYDCEKLDKLSDRQILDLYEAWINGEDSVTTDGGTINIVGVPAAGPNINISNQQLLKKIKHAPDFGIQGGSNAANLAKYGQAIENHVVDPATQDIQGTYRGQSVIHYVNPNTGLNVMTSRAGDYISGWKLNPAQLQNVLTRGSL